MFLFSPTFGQTIEVRSHFLADSIRVGEPVPYALTARYQRNLNILFPDSTFAFDKFEMERKEFFPTLTRDSISYDSVVYYLSSYELDTLQTLSIPVFIAHASDCTAIFGRRDTVIMKHLIANMPDSVDTKQLPLKSNTSYINVQMLFNYLTFILITLCVIVALIIFWAMYGRRIIKYFRIQRLKRRHSSFMQNFEAAVNQAQQGFTAVKAEKAMLIWKRYMETLDGKPYTRWSSSEIVSMADDQHLLNTLRGVDRAIYGGRAEGTKAFQELSEYTQGQFNKKIEQVNYE